MKMRRKTIIWRRQSSVTVHNDRKGEQCCRLKRFQSPAPRMTRLLIDDLSLWESAIGGSQQIGFQESSLLVL